MADHQFAFLTSTTHPGFLNAPPLAGRPGAQVVVAGIAWDGSTTNRPGSRFGPFAIRRASHMLCDGWHPLFKVSPVDALADIGDLALPNTSLSAMRAALEPLASDLIARHHMVWLGGDHSITLPLLRAYRAWHGRALALMHFDAHCDTWPDHAGEPSGHGTWVREAIIEGLVDPRLTVQFGIRSSAHPEVGEYVRTQGGLIYTGRDLRGRTSPVELRDICTEVRARLASMPEVDDISLFGTKLHVRGKEKTGEKEDFLEGRVIDALHGLVPAENIRRVAPTLEDAFVLFSEGDDEAAA